MGRTVNEWRDLDEARMLAEVEKSTPGVKAELILSTGERVILDRKNIAIESVKEMGDSE